jgi:hypothetical protein
MDFQVNLHSKWKFAYYHSTAPHLREEIALSSNLETTPGHTLAGAGRAFYPVWFLIHAKQKDAITLCYGILFDVFQGAPPAPTLLPPVPVLPAL